MGLPLDVERKLTDTQKKKVTDKTRSVAERIFFPSPAKLSESMVFGGKKLSLHSPEYADLVGKRWGKKMRNAELRSLDEIYSAFRVARKRDRKIGQHEMENLRDNLRLSKRGFRATGKSAEWRARELKKGIMKTGDLDKLVQEVRESRRKQAAELLRLRNSGWYKQFLGKRKEEIERKKARLSKRAKSK